MTADQVFQLCGTLALVGWLGLALTPLWPGHWRERISRPVFGIAIPAILAVFYATLILFHWSGHRGGFNSLDAVMQLFTDRWLVAAGWIHYLAFDLFLGGWELEDSRKRRVPHLAVVPCLMLTFLFGPIGLLAYLTLRVFFRPPGGAVAAERQT